jgi:hypothetical protein
MSGAGKRQEADDWPAGGTCQRQEKLAAFFSVCLPTETSDWLRPWRPRGCAVAFSLRWGIPQPAARGNQIPAAVSMVASAPARCAPPDRDEIKISAAAYALNCMAETVNAAKCLQMIQIHLRTGQSKVIGVLLRGADGEMGDAA